MPDVDVLQAPSTTPASTSTAPRTRPRASSTSSGARLDTSRRFDALKVLIALRATGRRRLGEMVDQVLALAAVRRARRSSAHPELELLTPPSTVMVAFRHAATTRPTSASTATCSPPAAAVIGRTRVNGAVALKLTLLNPRHDRARHRRAARRDRQRGSLTGSLHGAHVAGRVAHACR